MKKATMNSQNSGLDFIVPNPIGSDTDWICRTNHLVILADQAEQSRFLQDIIDQVKS